MKRQPWTREMNARRCELIDKMIDSTLTEAEGGELRALQEAMLNFRKSVAPLLTEEDRLTLFEFKRQLSNATDQADQAD